MNSSTILDFIIFYTPAGNLTLPSFNFLLYLFGNYELLSTLNLTFVMNFAVVGVLLNALAFIVLLREHFKVPLYFYLKVSVVTSGLIDILEVFYCLSRAPYNIAIGNTKATQIYLIYIYVPLINLLIRYKITLDIIITLDRIATFKPSVKKIMKLHSTTNAIIGLVASLIIEFPNYMTFQLAVYKIFRASTGQTEDFYLSELTEVAQYNGLFFLIYTLCKNVAIIIILVGLNVISLVLFREFLAKKKKLAKPKAEPISTTHSVVSPVQDNQKSATSAQPTTGNNQKSSKKNKSLSDSSEKNATKMVYIICAFSIFQQIFGIITFAYINFFLGTYAASVLIFVDQLNVIIKHAINFLIFYECDKNFNREFKKMFGCFTFGKKSKERTTLQTN